MAIQLYDDYDNSSRGFVGAGGQLCILDKTLNKYKLFIPVETLPSVAGSANTVDNDVTTSRSVGKIESKGSLDSKDVTFLWNRDDLLRLMEHSNEMCDFLVAYPDGTGWKFRATYTIKPEDVSASDKATGTFTLVPSEADVEPTLDVFDMMIPTCTFTSAIDRDTLITNGKSVTINLKAKAPSATFVAKSSNSKITATINTNVLTISTTATDKISGIVTITASATGYASWFATTRVIANN